MKREDLKKKFIELGLAEDKINDAVDFVMSANGNDLNTLKSELEATKGKYADDMKSKDETIKGYEEKIKGFADYEDLKKFKADTEANAEKSKRIDFLKSNGCKHPDLMMDKLDFSKAKYDEEKKTFTGLDDDIKNLKTSYADLFENKQPTIIKPNVQTNNNVNGEITQRYLAEHPEMAKFMQPLANQNNQ